MVVTVAAAWLTGSKKEHRRAIGFWAFLISNVLWVIWGYFAQAWALILLQIFLAIMNIRGAKKNEETA